MAENQEDHSSGDLAEEASPFRVEEMRRLGQVPQSRELAAFAAVLAAAITAWVVSPTIGAQIADFMREVFRTDLMSRLDLGRGDALASVMSKTLHLLVSLALPIGAAGFIVGALASFVQVGSVFTFEPIQPDFAKVNPLSGIKKLISPKKLLEMFVLMAKTAVLGAIAYGAVKTEILKSPHHLLVDPVALFGSYSQAARLVFLPMIMALGAFSLYDFGMQRWEYMKRVRPTKEEAKREFKEREGDPAIKARIRGIQREVARRRMMAAVKKADVIITNPTHIAIAIVYDRENMAAPRVVAKGADFMAQKIKKVAADAGVPLVENVPLARTLFKTVKIGQSIPRSLYQAVAEVLAYVYRLQGKRL